jgi:hypothetical protein
VATTLNARPLSLVRRELKIKQVYVTDIREVLRAATAWSDLGTAEVQRIADTQFRSLWYLPLLAKWVSEDRPVPSRLDDVPSLGDEDPVVVSVVDNFGNCKFDCRPDDIGFTVGASLPVAGQDVKCYPHLTDVPHGSAGLIPGSSGFDFVELVIRGASAADRFGLQPGDAPLSRRTTPPYAV